MNIPTSEFDAIMDRFAYHTPANESVSDAHMAMRTAARAMAIKIIEVVPNGRHRALALTAVQEAMMWGNAGIACDSEAVTS